MGDNGLDHAHSAVPPDAVVTAARARPIAPVAAPDERPQELRHYLRVLVAHRRLMTWVFAATLGLTVVVTALTPRRYSASTRLQVARQSPIQLRLADNVRRLDDTDPTVSATFVATQVAALQSRDLAARVLGRAAVARRFAAPATGGSLRALAGTLPDALRPLAWADVPAAAAASEPPVPVDPKLVDGYEKALAVYAVAGTDLIEVRFTTPDPELSAVLAAAHAQAFIEANDAARRATDQVADAFLDQQLADSRAQVERTDQALATFAAEHPNVAVDREQNVVAGRIATLAALLTKAEATRATLESRYDFLRNPDSDRLAYFLDEPGVQKLRLALLDVHAQQAALRQRLGPNHPQMLQLSELEGEMSRQLGTEVGQSVEAVRSHWDAERMREDRLRAKLERQEQDGVELRSLGARYDLLAKDVETARKLHTSILKQRMETRVNAALVPTNVRVIERPEVPHRPSRPKVPLNLALGLFGATVLAVGAAFGREYLDGTVRSSDEAEALLQLPALAAIPNFALARRAASGNGEMPILGYDGGDELLVLHEPSSRAAEAFRAMRTLLFSSAERAPKVVLLTSAQPGEGKTVASLNLASTLAELGGRTLLVDADLRHPRCHAALGVGNQRGLSSWLAGHAELDELIAPLDVPELFFLAAGPPPRNPADLIASPRMRHALALLRERFDFVVLDTPPVLPVTDAAILAREVDGVVLVVKGHETPAEAVRRARDRLGRAGARFLGLVMNNVGLAWGDPYFYDTYYTDTEANQGRQTARARA